MKGSIRAIVGLLVVFGAVGGVETSLTTAAMLVSSAVALVGLAVMGSGVSAMKGA